MKAKLREQDDDPYRAHRPGGIAAYRRLLGDLAVHPVRLTLILLAALGVSAGTVAIPWLVRTTLQRFGETPGCRVTALGLAAIAGVSVLVVGLQFVARYGMAWIGQAMLVDLRRRLFDKSLDLPPAELARTGSGNVISRILNDAEHALSRFVVRRQLRIPIRDGSPLGVVVERWRSDIVRVGIHERASANAYAAEGHDVAEQ